ncbi:MAG: VTC domain-containing protein [bacterium]|nr:VTC domain-containing protein [bacterium]
MRTRFFLEIKSKIDGTVFKRRISLKSADFARFLRTGELENSQVGREIQHIFREKNLKPKVFIAYDRLSYKLRTKNELRITLDANLRFRKQNLNFENDSNAVKFFENPTFIMETKTMHGFPQWFVDYLSKEQIYPTSFSKYGKIYQQKMKIKEENV